MTKKYLKILVIIKNILLINYDFLMNFQIKIVDNIVTRL